MSNNNSVTANIKAFMRPEKFKECLECVIRANISYIVVGYDGPLGPIREEHLNIIKEMSKQVENIQLVELPFNAGLSKVRNEMVKVTDTEYILQLDDDSYVPSNVTEILEFMKDHKKIGGTAIGYVQPPYCCPDMDAFDMEIVKKYLYRTFHEPKYYLSIKSNTYIYPFDFIPNQIMFRKALFKEVQWDEHFKIWGEHEDFFLRCMKTKWQFAICSTMHAVHASLGNKQFMSYRYGPEINDSVEYFYKKWGIEGFIPQRWQSMWYEANSYHDKMLRDNKYYKYKLIEEITEKNDFFWKKNNTKWTV